MKSETTGLKFNYFNEYYLFSKNEKRNNSHTSHSIIKIVGDILARRIHTKKELQQKLERKGICKEDIEQALRRAEELKWLDDRNAAVSIVNELIRKGGHGRAWARKKMMEKGIEESLIEETLDSLWNYETEQQLIKAALNKIIRIKGTQATRQKVFAALMRRGFGHESVIDVCSKYYSEERQP